MLEAIENVLYLTACTDCWLQKFEDTNLELKSLPAPKLVVTPDGLPNESFGDIAMVTEFISCFSGLLMPDDEYPIYTGKDYDF